MLIVGLTGGIATGKSTVANYLKSLGCHIIDADDIAKTVVQPYKPAWKDIVHSFGEEVLLEDGSLNRQKLGDIIFVDNEKRKLLNRITHPRIFRCILTEIFVCILKGERILVLDLPLLFEKKYNKLWPLSQIIVVYCERKQQLDRLIKRNGLTIQQATERVNCQMNLEEKCKLADIIVDNSKDLEFMKEQILHHFRILNSSRIILRNRCLIAAFLICMIVVLYYLIIKILALF